MVTRKCKVCRKRKLLKSGFRLWRCKARLGKYYYRHVCKVCERAGNIEYCNRKPHKSAASRHEAYMKNKLRVMALTGFTCRVCGFDDPRALQIDHVNGKGAYSQSHIGTKKFLDEVIAQPWEYQTLCANHNWIKRAENQEVRI